MKSLFKILSICFLLFLVPITLNSIGSFDINYANAVDLNCGELDFSCGVSEGILSVWEIIWFYLTQVI
ncbi:MAG: hypothetical protein MRY57_00920, partial [Candidatus Pacebacteria bacterium]|nr:hypothetical protein [Candidatus Paceibacterota bacterium]